MKQEQAVRSQEQGLTSISQVVFLSSEGDGEVWTALAAKALHRATARLIDLFYITMFWAWLDSISRTPTPCLTDSHQGRWAPKRGPPASESRNNPPNHATRQPTQPLHRHKPKKQPPQPPFISVRVWDEYGSVQFLRSHGLNSWFIQGFLETTMCCTVHTTYYCVCAQ